MIHIIYLPKQERPLIACNDEQGDPFYSPGPHGNRISHAYPSKKRRFGWEKVEQTWKIERGLPGGRRSMRGYILIYPRIYSEKL